jgi:hypothetical protein
MIMHFMLKLNISNIFQPYNTNPKECLLKFTRHWEMPSIYIMLGHEVHQDVDDEDSTVQIVQRSPHASTKKKVRTSFLLPRHEYVEHCMRTACSQTTGSRCNISDLATWIRKYNSATDSTAVIGCIVTSCLWTKHTILMCGQMTILTPLWKVTFKHVPMSMCDVQFWMISWLVLSSMKTALQDSCTYNFGKRNCPNFWRMHLWINKVICYPNMTETLLIFHAKLEISITTVSLVDGSDRAVPKIGKPDLQT